MDFNEFPTLFGKSKDGVILLSIPEPVCNKFHLFANIISKFESWPNNVKQRNNAQSMIKEYLSEVSIKSLFLISRKKESESYNRRYRETNPNGLCGGIALYQLKKRHNHGYFSNSGFKNNALDFHDANTRKDFITFLRTIKPTQSSSNENVKILNSVQAMIDWTEQKYFTSPSTRSIGKSPTTFPLEQWWSTFWFSDIHTDFPFTLFLDAKNSSIESEYLVASLFSIPEVEGSRITYSQAKLVVGQPNYFQFDSSHFFLLQSAQASMETKRLTQSLVDLSRNILSFILQNFNPDGTFQGDNKKSNKILIDLCPAVVDSPF